VIPAPLIFSILSPLENAVSWLLERFHNNLGLPWSWAIIATTIVVRVALVPLTVRQIHSMQALQRHAPEMKELQRKYKGDRQKLSEETMKFYKENNINPAASCLPLVAQLPVFFSLYLVLKHFNRDIHGSHPNLSWLHFVPNITASADSHWSGFLLLAVYAASQISSTYFMSAAMDKTQRRLMMVLPLIFITFIARFKVGLVLYWVTTNLWTVGQGVVTRRLVPKTAPGTPGLTGPKRSSRVPPAAAKTTAEARPADGGAVAKRPAGSGPPGQPRRVKRKGGSARR
jgi:YidC/Oxa1 family membrane protein insertase